MSLEMSSQTAIVIGAGPAGLTAACELLERTQIRPVVLERSEFMGGIARTVNYKGNRIDIGGHRFFSKSDRVMQWWFDILPMESAGVRPDSVDRVMLVRSRKSRIYFLRKFFDYPIRLTPGTLAKLGARRTLRIGLSYLWRALFPVRPERNLEQFFTNRFGSELYRTFFKDYTEKVWGVPCDRISAEWGSQRVKGLSVARTVLHFFRQIFRKSAGVAQRGTETSLIERFLYPKYGPGQMWEEVARRVGSKGGQVLTGWEVRGIHCSGRRVTAVTAVNPATGEARRFEGDCFFSTMAVKDLVRALDADVPPPVRETAEALEYRDFITVGLLADRLEVHETGGGPIEDNWIYIQEPDVLVGRLQLFHNWSPYLAADPSKVWIGLEYFCFEGDSLWTRTDAELVELAKTELERIGVLDPALVRDATVIRTQKTYPAYFGAYENFGVLREYLDRFENLYLIGRNGMHRYNNQDHSMLTAMTAVDNIVAGISSKENIWAVNTEEEYHEEK
ncbi:MAG: NAD(P)/FAD-dependent oxidoreductase [Bryobacterales bacterium]|nr:NAD(P)/FAD-dependent oxidoreductase [Bryobacterales bacterium]